MIGAKSDPGRVLVSNVTSMATFGRDETRSRSGSGLESTALRHKRSTLSESRGLIRCPCFCGTESPLNHLLLDSMSHAPPTALPGSMLTVVLLRLETTRIASDWCL